MIDSYDSYAVLFDSRVEKPVPTGQSLGGGLSRLKEG